MARYTVPSHIHNAIINGVTHVRLAPGLHQVTGYGSTEHDGEVVTYIDVKPTEVLHLEDMPITVKEIVDV